MKYDIVTYGNSLLRRSAVPIDRIDESIRELASDMLETMYANDGLGLAAEQIGRTEAICVVDVPPLEDENTDDPRVQENRKIKMPLIMINPRITEAKGAQDGKEGCLSFPEIFVGIKRAEQVTVVFKDLTDVEQEVTAHGLLSRAIQHELDHLNGVLLVDKMSAVQKVAVSGKLKKLRKQAQE